MRSLSVRRKGDSIGSSIRHAVRSASGVFFRGRQWIPRGCDLVRSLSVLRRHGLGNVVQLLRRLVVEAQEGRPVELVTRPEWVAPLQELAPGVAFGTEARAETINLDAATEMLVPSEHRQAEFARLLGLEPREPTYLTVPASWRDAWQHVRRHVAFSPEAEHPSRRCPEARAVEIAGALRLAAPTLLLGNSTEPAMPADLDLRQRTTLPQLIGVLANVSAVVCMDSGILHVALAVRTPVVAIFGGIDPVYRIDPGERCIALVGAVPCRPCNKNETCEGRYDCLQRQSGSTVFSALAALGSCTRREIREL